MDETDEVRPILNKFGAHHLLWLNCLQKIEDGKIKRLLGLLPPGSGKSIYSSVVFPTHYMGRFANHNVIVASYGDVLPRKFGRRGRSIVKQPIYKRIFNTSLSTESSAADEWSLTNGSEWMAAGILTGITGNRVDLAIWDDPIKGRQEADSEVIRNKTWDAYMDDLMTRKKPNASEIGILCLAGNTQVSMGDGTRKAIKDIRIGDNVVSYFAGKSLISRVINWKNQGPDRVYEIRTGGSIVKANARHPFLVARTFHENTNKRLKRAQSWPLLGDEYLEWVRVVDLKVGDKLVTSSNFAGRENGVLTPDQAWLLGYMFGDGWITKRDTKQVGYKGRIYPRRGLVTCVALSNDVQENDKVTELFLQLFNVKLKRTKSSQQVTEVARIGRWFIAHGLTGKAKTKKLPPFIFSEPEKIRSAFLEGFIDADGHRTAVGKRGAGGISLASCNIGLLEDFKQLARGLGFKVRNVFAKQSWMQAPNSPKPTFSTQASLAFRPERINSNFILRNISSIKECEIEDVFDIQIEGTENFIADGLVSHNTRWHEDDPAGRILPLNYNGESGWIKGRDGNDWYVICLPAECERADDPLGRKIGEILWPEWFTQEHFAPFKLNTRTWSSLFQQRPAPESGDYFQSGWLKPYTKAPPLETLRIYGASDYAVSQDKGDYTVHIIVGIDPLDQIYLLDLWREQKSSDIWVEEFCNLVEKWRPMGWAEEKGQIASSMGPLITKRMRERKLYMARKGFPTRGDKTIRCQSIRGRMAMNGLYVPAHASWYSAFKAELMVFPNGNYDDQADALGLIGQVLDVMVAGAPASLEDKKPKVFSTNPQECTVTLDDLWSFNEKKNSKNKLRIA